MILTPDETSRRNIETGVWSRVTLDQVFRKRLATDGDDVAFRDCGASHVPGLSASLTFAEAERRIEGLAAFFASLGLKPDTVLGIHLPACADAAIIMLAALRAGMVVCPLPIYWTKKEIETAIAAAAIRGIVTASEIESDPSGELVRDVAADTFAIRFVFSVGRGAPDGLITLDDIWADLDHLGPAPEVARRGNAADHTALLSIAAAPDDRLVVVPHSHNHLVASALAHLLEGGVAGPETILTTMHPASVATVAGAMLTAFLAGGAVAFHHGVSLEDLGEAVAAAGCDRLLLPAAFAAAADVVTAPEIAFSMVSTGLESVAPPRLARARKAVDLVTVGGTCLLPIARDADGAPGVLPIGPAHLPSRGGAGGPVFYETRVRTRQPRPGERRGERTPSELQLRGPIVPDAPWPEPTSGASGAVLGFTSDGFLRTGLLAEPTEDQTGLSIDGPVHDSVVVAGRALSAARLDALFRRHPDVADAAVFRIAGGEGPDRLGLAVVARTGRQPDYYDLLDWLDAEGAGALDRPGSMIAVPEIPRAADGTVLRDALLWKAVA